MAQAGQPQWVAALSVTISSRRFYEHQRLIPRPGRAQREEETQLDYRARELGIYSGFGDEWLRIGGLKMATGGGTTPHTAYMYEPYEGDTELVAFNCLEVDRLHRYFRTAQETDRLG